MPNFTKKKNIYILYKNDQDKTKPLNFRTSKQSKQYFLDQLQFSRTIPTLCHSQRTTQKRRGMFISGEGAQKVQHSGYHFNIILDFGFSNLFLTGFGCRLVKVQYSWYWCKYWFLSVKTLLIASLCEILLAVVMFGMQNADILVCDTRQSVEWRWRYFMKNTKLYGFSC